MEQTIETLKKSLEKEKSDNIKLQEDRQNLFKTYEAVEQQLNLLKEKSDKSLKKDNEFTLNYHQLEVEYNNLQENYNEINNLLQQEKNEKEDLVTSNNDLEQYCAELQQQRNDLEKKYGNLQNEYLLCSQEVKKNKSELHNSLEMQKELESIKNQEIEFCHKQIESLQKVYFYYYSKKKKKSYSFKISFLTYIYYTIMFSMLYIYIYILFYFKIKGIIWFKR